jgi:hypothetical protein
LRVIDLTGQKFWRLTVLRRAENSASGSARWLCSCECSNETVVCGSDLKSKRTQSCGCLRKEIGSTSSHYKHGQSHAREGGPSRTYSTWQAMITRCTNPKQKSYLYYGGRGIAVCERWLNREHGFENFLADMGERPKGTTLDRKNTNGNYEPDNCKWATAAQQSQNQRDNRINMDTAKEIRRLHFVEGLRQPDISRSLNIPYLIVNRVVRNYAWREPVAA